MFAYLLFLLFFSFCCFETGLPCVTLVGLQIMVFPLPSKCQDALKPACWLRNCFIACIHLRMCLHVCACTWPLCRCGGQRLTCGDGVSFSTLWAWEIELSSLSLEAATLPSHPLKASFKGRGMAVQYGRLSVGSFAKLRVLTVSCKIRVDKLVLKSGFGSTVICNHSALIAVFRKWKNYLYLMVTK